MNCIAIMTFSLKVVILISSSSGLLLSLSTVWTVFFTILLSIFNICMNYIILIMTLNLHQTFVRVHMYIKHLIFLCHLQHLIISFFINHFVYLLTFPTLCLSNGTPAIDLGKNPLEIIQYIRYIPNTKSLSVGRIAFFRATACPRQDWRFKNTVLKWMCHEIFHLSILLRNRTNLSPW